MSPTDTDPLLSLIIPTYNEAGNILDLLDAVHQALPHTPHEVIVVDDNSPDGTWRYVEDFSQTNSWARVIRRQGERGLSSAVIRGFEAARGKILGVMDADLSHDESILPALIRKIQNGAEMAVGSRRIPGGGAVEWPWFRRLTSSVATWLAKNILGASLSDPMSGYFVLQQSLLESCKQRLNPTGYKILLEIYCKARPKHVSEVPFVFRNRREGQSKLTGVVMWQYLKMLFALKMSSCCDRHPRNP